jgi:hypothetical protein
LWFSKATGKSQRSPLPPIRLRRTPGQYLFLQHAFDAHYPYTLRIRLRNAKISRIQYYDNRLKEGDWVQPKFQFTGVKEGQTTATPIVIFL